MPTMPPASSGHNRAISMCLRCGQIVVRCSSVPQPVIRIAECSGSIRCSQIDDAASPKAKPLPPAAMPPSSAPSQRKPSVSNGTPSTIGSAQIEDEEKADGDHAGKAEREGGERLFAEVEEFHRQH